MNENKNKQLSELQKDKVPEHVKEVFRRKPYETLAERAERRAREGMCVGCLGAASGDCKECEGE